MTGKTLNRWASYKRPVQFFSLVLAVSISSLLLNEGLRAQSNSAGQATTTPRRPAPDSRFDYRGEHAGVIYTPGGWRELGIDPAMIGADFFTPLASSRGLSVYLPYMHGTTIRQPPVTLGASFEIVRPDVQKPDAQKAGASKPEAGHYEARAREVAIPNEFVEVYHPAVYEADETGKEQLVEKEEITRVPKVRIVISRVWVEGKPPAAPAK